MVEYIRKPLFGFQKDIRYLSGIHKGFHKIMFPKIAVILSKDTYDPLYLENPEVLKDIENSDPIIVRVKVRADPPKAELKKYGIEQNRSIRYTFDSSEARQHGLDVKNLLGAFTFLESEVYRITEVFPEDYITYHVSDATKENLPYLNIVAFGVKIRPFSSTVDAQLPDTPKSDVLFGRNKDVLYIKERSKELYDKIFEPIAIYYPKSLDYDPLYGESDRLPEFVRYDIPGMVTRGDDAMRDFFGKTGVNKTRDMNLDFQIESFKSRGISLPMIGTVVAVEGDFYMVNETRFVDKFFNTTNEYSRISCLLNKLRPSSMPDVGDQVPKDPPSTSKLLFLGKDDISFLADVQRDYHETAFVDIEFIDRIFDQDYDTLYLEDVNEFLVKGNRYKIPAAVVVTPNRQRLRKFGIESVRDIQLFVSLSAISSRIPIKPGEVEPTLGTLFVYEGEVYYITDQDPCHYFGNTRRFLSYSLFAKKLRSSIKESNYIIESDSVKVDDNKSVTIERSLTADMSEYTKDDK